MALSKSSIKIKSEGVSIWLLSDFCVIVFFFLKIVWEAEVREPVGVPVGARAQGGAGRPGGGAPARRRARATAAHGLRHRGERTVRRVRRRVHGHHRVTAFAPLRLLVGTGRQSRPPVVALVSMTIIAALFWCTWELESLYKSECWREVRE